MPASDFAKSKLSVDSTHVHPSPCVHGLMLICSTGMLVCILLDSVCTQSSPCFYIYMELRVRVGAGAFTNLCRYRHFSHLLIREYILQACLLTVMIRYTCIKPVKSPWLSWDASFALGASKSGRVQRSSYIRGRYSTEVATA